jgi:hypothetical protein
MKKRFGCIAVLLLPVWLTAAGPVMKFKTAMLDFGEIESGKIADIRFEFVNAGDAQLVVKNVIPSCGCTTAELKQKTFEPGEKGEIPVKFNTSGYSGKVTKNVTVLSNDSENPEVRLIISGIVTMKDFSQGSINPEQLQFGKVQAGKSYTRKVVLANSGNQELLVIEVCSPPEMALVFSNRRVPPHEKAEIDVTFTPFDNGTYSTLVKIRTNDPRRAFMFLRVEAVVE